MPVTPVFVSPLAYPLSQFVTEGILGQFKNGSRWWILATSVASAVATPILTAYSSDDDGATWTPRVTGASVYNSIASVHYPGTGTQIAIGYLIANAFGSMRAVMFDMAGNSGDGAFGVPFTIPFDTGQAGLTLAFQLLLLSNGDLAFCWQEETFSDQWSVSVAIYSGSWSSRLNVGVSTVNKRLREVVLYPDDKVGLLWYNVNFFSVKPGTFSLTNGTTLVSETLAYNHANLIAGQSLNLQTIGLFDTDSDSVVFAVQRSTTGPAPDFDDYATISLVVGTPSATPVFTVVDVYSFDAQLNPTWYLDFPWIVKTSTGFSLFFGYGVDFGLFADGNFQILRTDSTSLAGPWPAPSVVYDLHANPFPIAPLTDNLECMWVSVLADDTIGVTVGMIQVIAPSTNWCGVLGFFSQVPAVAPVITLDASVGASFTFGTTGGGGISSASHTLCFINTATAGALVDTPYIVRRYAFNQEPMPQDVIYFTPWSDLGWQYQKIARNLLLDIDTGGVAAAVQLETDGGSVQTFSVNSTSNNRDRVLATNSDLEGKLWRLSLTPGTNGKAQLFKAGLDYVPDCNILTYADSLEQNFGYPSWKYIKEVWVYYKGGPLTITILVDGGLTFFSHTLPAVTCRSVERFYLPAAYGGVLNKSKKYRVKMAAPLGFRLYQNSALEWYGFSADELGSFNLMQIHPEMLQNIGQQTTGAWQLGV